MAAIDFPNSPAVDDIFTAGTSSYRWTGVAWVSNNLGTIEWSAIANKPVTLSVLSDTAPSSPAEGQKWLNTTNFIEYVYYDSTWVEV